MSAVQWLFLFLSFVLVFLPTSIHAETTVTAPVAATPASTCTAEQTAENRRIIDHCNSQWSVWGIDRPTNNELRQVNECSSGATQTGAYFLQGCANAVAAPFILIGNMAALGIVTLTTGEDPHSDRAVFAHGNLEQIEARLAENWLIERCGLGAVHEDRFMEQECPNNPLSQEPRDCNPALAKLNEQRECRSNAKTRADYRAVRDEHSRQAQDLIQQQRDRAQAEETHDNAVATITQACGTHINPYRRSILARVTNPSRYLATELWHQLKPSEESVNAFNQCVRNHPQSTDAVVAEMLESPAGIVDNLVSEYEAFQCYSAPVRNQLYCEVAAIVLSGGTALSATAAKKLGQRGLRRATLETVQEVGEETVEQRLRRFSKETDFSSIMNRGESALGRSFSPVEQDALYRAHLVGRGELGADGINPAGVGNYTTAQLAEKTKILSEAFSDRLDRGRLIRSAAAGDSLPWNPAFESAYAARNFSGNNQFISAMITGLDGTPQRRAMQIMGVNPDGTLDVVVEMAEGDLRRMNYPLSHFHEIRLSETSKTLFARVHTERFERLAAPHNSIVFRSLSGNEYQGVSRGIQTINGERYLILETANGQQQLVRMSHLDMQSIRQTANSPAPKPDVTEIAPLPSVEKPAQSLSPTPLPSYNPALPLHQINAEALASSQTVFARATAREGDSFYGGMGYWREWSGNMERTSEIPVQGWKVHISARVENAGNVAETVLPILQERGIVHKVVSDVDAYRNLLARPNNTQVGKFITFYPRNEEEAREISRILSAALERRGFSSNDFIPVAGESPSGLGLYARYGKIVDQNLIGPDGNPIPGTQGMIFDASGQPVPDVLGKPHPSWIAPLGR